jgi:PAS domain S-box-containing protein
MDELADVPEYVAALNFAPTAILVSRHRNIRFYNRLFCSIFGCGPHELVGRSLECIYASHSEFERVGVRVLPFMKATGSFSEDRILKRNDGTLFWCRVSGCAFNLSEPYAGAAWIFEDLSAVRNVSNRLTPREREVAQLLVAGKTSKLIARELGLSSRTIEAYRASLSQKLGVSSASHLIAKLVGAR